MSLIKAPLNRTFIALLLTPALTFALPVKQSSSGLCHTEQSPYYERTTNYSSFESLEACLRDGGKAQSGLKGAPAANENTYERSKFGHGWDDEDSDCQNSRMEALISQSTGPVRFASSDKCRVISGRWISPFTGNVINEASKIDIDHVVPLKFAWEHGADSWSKTERVQFGNDPMNLWSVEASLNRSKGAQGPTKWLPPSGQCQYISRFVRIMRIYDLKLGEREEEEYEALRQDCQTTSN